MADRSPSREMARRLTTVAILAVATAFSASQIASAEIATRTSPPVAVSRVAPDRQALIVAAGHPPAEADAARYSELLRLLGFQVTLAAADTRPEIKGAFATFAAQVKPGGEVAVFVLGGLLPKDDDLYLFASDAEPPLEVYPSEGLRLADAMRPIADRGPRDTVLFVDLCRPAHGQACHIGAATVPDGVSAIVGVRQKPIETGEPVAGVASLGGELLSLMRQENLSDLALYGALAKSLAGTNMGVAATPSLSRNFAFLPTGFFAGLPTACNRVDPSATAESLRSGASVEPLVSACVQAAATWAAWPWFKDRLAAAREQAAFQAAARGCRSAPIAADLAAYPDGRYASAVHQIDDACAANRRRAAEVAPAPPPPALPEPETTATTCTVGGLDPAGINWLALRSAPSLRAPWSTTQMGPGTVVNVLGRADQWAHVQLASGEMGWANGKFLICNGARPRAAPGGCIVDGLDPMGDNWLALRNSPDSRAPWSQRHMGPGTPLDVFGRSGPWLHVRLDTGEVGWASSRYVRCGR